MLNQIQSDALLAYCDAKIATIKNEIETSEAVHAEAPNKNEWLDFCHTDFIHGLICKQAWYQQIRDEVEMLETADDIPAVSPNRAAIFAVNAVGVIGGVAIGLLLAVAILGTPQDMLWNNVESFWRQLI